MHCIARIKHCKLVSAKYQKDEAKVIQGHTGFKRRLEDLAGDREDLVCLAFLYAHVLHVISSGLV